MLQAWIRGYKIVALLHRTRFTHTYGRRNRFRRGIAVLMVDGASPALSTDSAGTYSAPADSGICFADRRPDLWP